MQRGLRLGGLLEQRAGGAGEIDVGRVALNGLAEHLGGEGGVGGGGIGASQAEIERNEDEIEVEIGVPRRGNVGTHDEVDRLLLARLQSQHACEET